MNVREKAKPILFNTEMVRAILDGRKTETRRPIKGRFDICKTLDGTIADIQRKDENDNWTGSIKPPYQKGDILYVRETVYWETFCLPPGEGVWVYRADFEQYPTTPGRWCPSIHMPKEAARIFLEVTDVRVERLQDITEEGARAEGFLSDGNFMAKFSFCDTWDAIYKGRGYGWDANPWVWVTEFKRIERELAG